MTRNRENFVVLMENYDKALKYSTASVESFGSAEQKMAVYTENNEAKIKRFTAAFEGLSTTVADNGVIGFFTDMGTLGLKAIEELLSGWAKFPIIIASVTFAFAALSGVIKTLNLGSLFSGLGTNILAPFVGLTNGIKTLIATQTALAVSQKAVAASQLYGVSTSTVLTASTLAQVTAWDVLTFSIGSATKAMLAFVVSNPILAGVAFAATVAGIALAVSSLEVTFKEQLKIVDDLEEEYKKTSSEVDKITSKLEDNKNKIIEINKNPLDIISENTLKALELENIELERQLAIKLKIADQDKAKLGKATTKLFENKTEERLNWSDDSQGGVIIEKISKVEKMAEEIENVRIYNEQLKQLGDTYDEQKVKIETSGRSEIQIKKEVAALDDEYLRQSSIIQASNDASNKYLSDNISLISEKKNSLDLLIPAQKALYDSLVGLEDAYIGLSTTSPEFNTFEKIFNSKLTEEQRLKLIELAEQGRLTADSLASSFPVVSIMFKALGFDIDDVKQKLVSMGEVSSSPNLSKFEESLVSLKNNLSMLETAQYQSGTANGITADTYNALIAANSEYADILTVVDGKIQMATADTLEQKKVLIDAALQQAILTSQSKEQIDTLKSQSIELQKQIEIVGKYKGSSINLINIEEATKQIDAIRSIKAEIKEYGEISQTSLDSIIELFPEMTDDLNNMGELQASLTAKETSLNEEKKISYMNYILEKKQYDDDFYNSSILANGALVTEFKRMYGIDLTNAANTAKAKELIEKTLISNLAGAWSEYFGIVADANGNLVADFQGVVSSPEEEIAAYKANAKLQEQLKKYNEASKKFDDLARTAVSDLGDYSPDLKGDSASGGKASKSSSDAYKEAAEKEIKELEYLHESKQISEEMFLKRLDILNRKYYENKEKYIDEYSKNALKIINDTQKMEEDKLKTQAGFAKDDKNYAKQIELYEDMQKSIKAIADKYRSYGYAEDSIGIMELQKQWREYAKNIDDINKEHFDYEKQLLDQSLEDGKISKQEYYDSLRLLDKAYLENSKTLVDDSESIKREIDQGSGEIFDERIAILDHQIEMLVDGNSKITQTFQEGSTELFQTADTESIINLYIQKRLELINRMNELKSAGVSSTSDLMMGLQSEFAQNENDITQIQSQAFQDRISITTEYISRKRELNEYSQIDEMNKLNELLVYVNEMNAKKLISDKEAADAKYNILKGIADAEQAMINQTFEVMRKELALLKGNEQYNVLK